MAPIKNNRLFTLFCGLTLLSLLTRLWILQELSAKVLGCRLCIIPGVIEADAPYLLGVLGLFMVAGLSRRRWWFLPWRVLAFTSLAVYIADVAVMSEYFTRLKLSDAIIYLAQPAIVWRYLLNFPIFDWVVVAFTLGIMAWAGWVRPARSLPRPAVIIALAMLVPVGAIAHYVIPRPDYVHEWAVRNVVAANLPSGLAEDYSPAMRKDVAQAFGNTGKTCVPGEGRRDDIVMLVLESWSAYQSDYWSGLNDWTPRLDALASQGVSFMSLHAGGYNTNLGLISLLTGKQFALPIAEPQAAQPFATAWDLPDTLPESLNRLGYHTAFLTSGNLGFTRKGEWLSNIGFNYHEGQDFPGYAGKPRYHFDAVADDVLYERALAYIDEQDRSAPPNFIVIENVSSHQPYEQPYTGERDEQAVFRYMDDTAADFIEGLRHQGFFEHGLLVVISDHRAMTMVSSKERQLLGQAADSLIPAFVLTGNPRQEKVDALFHQADVMPTLLHHVADDVCLSHPKRDMLASAAGQPMCVMHARGNRRDNLDVFCPEGSGTVKVDGDDTHFILSRGLSEQRQKQLLLRIARDRLAGVHPPSP